MTEELKTGNNALAAFNDVDAVLAKINEEFAGKVYKVDDPAGMRVAKADLAIIRTGRTTTEKIRKEAKARKEAAAQVKRDEEAKEQKRLATVLKAKCGTQGDALKQIYAISKPVGSDSDMDAATLTERLSRIEIICEANMEAG